MSLFTKLGNDIAAPVDAAGNPRPVENADMQRWMTEVERATLAFQAGGGIIFPDKATMDGTLTYAANQMAWVMGDATAGNNGIYRKVGASGSGSWVRLGDLPFSMIPLANAGAGTADAIVAVPMLPLPTTPGAALLTVNIVAANTGSVTLNGKPLRTNLGNEIAPGGLTAGSIHAFLDMGDHFRLLSDQASGAIQAAAEAARDRAETARDIAEGYASDAVSQGNVPIYATIAGMAAVDVPVGINAIRINGRDAAGDGEGGLYVDTDNGSDDTFESGDGRTWFRAFETNADFNSVTRRVPYSTHTFKTPMSLAETPYSLTHGTTGSPSPAMEPIIAVKKISNAAVAGTPSTVGAFMMEKRTNAPQAHHTALLAEVLDYAGWDGTGLQNFCEGARLQAILEAGANNGSAYGTIAMAGCSAGVNYKYMIGCEGDVINNGGDAPVPSNFDKGKFAVSFLATPTFGTFKPDAGFATNPYASASNRFRTGFLVTEDSVEVAAFASRANVIFGLDLACGPGSVSYSAIRIPNAMPIHARNAAGTADIVMAYVDLDNAVVLGGGTGIKLNISGTNRQVTVDGDGFLKLL